MIKGFNVRSYGVLLSPEGDKVLLVDEQIFGQRLLKFPGGGVEHAEGPGPALKREFREELGLDIEIGDSFYVSPNLHHSYFRKQQVIGLYWWVLGYDGSPLTSQLPGLKVVWQSLKDWDITELTHEMDREVAKAVLADCGRK